MYFQNFDRVKKNFGFGSKDCILVHRFKFIGNTNSQFSFFFGKKLQMIKSGLFDEYFFMTKKNIVVLKLFEEVFVDKSLTLLFKILLSFEFAYILMETINIVV